MAIPESRVLPNLFVIGAMKSGTSSLHAYLNSHPEISMSAIKEPMFFSRVSDWEGRIEEYLGLFPGMDQVRYAGESSTEYTKAGRFPGVARRIYEFNPAARLIYVMRDPVERTVSQYWHMVRHHGERRPLLDAVRLDQEYVDISDYASQLDPYVALFGKEGLYALTFEELIRCPEATIRGLFSWLDLDLSHVPANPGESRHETPPILVQQRWPGAMSLVRSRVWSGIRPFVPGTLRRVGKQLAMREIQRSTSADDLHRLGEYLRPILVPRTRRLSALLERDFPEWEMLNGMK